jgi:hypothetical protein
MRAIQVHSVTFFVVFITMFLLLWLNFNPPIDWERELGNNQLKAPENLDSITKQMFYKGWPFSPCMFCTFHGMRWHPEEGGGVHLALLIDFLVLVVLTVVSGVISEWSIRGILKRKRPSAAHEDLFYEKPEERIFQESKENNQGIRRKRP